MIFFTNHCATSVYGLYFLHMHTNCTLTRGFFFRDLMKNINLDEEHFEMLLVPTNLEQLKSELSIRDFALPSFPITIEIPCGNAKIQELQLDFDRVLSDVQL